MKRLKLPQVIQKSINQAQHLLQELPQIIDKKSSDIYFLLKDIPAYTWWHFKSFSTTTTRSLPF
jgi:hypothetical protein